MTTRWDETWHRLREWTNGHAPSERLAVQILIAEGFESVDPSHPLGGKDGGKDAVCNKDGKRWVMGVYFPRGQQLFKEIENKFIGDLHGAKLNSAESFVFVTNQELRLAERSSLINLWPDNIQIYHLEKLTSILDSPLMAQVRQQFLNIGINSDTVVGIGGDGGGGTIIGNSGTVIGGRGGVGGAFGIGGKGGGGIIHGDNGLIVGGDGGNAGTPDGRGGRGACGPLERMEGPTNMWHYGRGGAGSNHPEYDRRLSQLKKIREEFIIQFPEKVPFIEAGVDQVPVNWVNKRLQELGEEWSVDIDDGGYILPPLEL